ncbi:MAG TPA: hypothetical protein VN671_13775, partial [Solirubrobacterales bacterium]|nr:hypothetical protein [Solirubrobacterales bacterium]
MGRVARRAAAIGSLGLAAGAVALAAILAVERFPRGIAVLACLCVALWTGWTALRHEGFGRAAAGVGCGAAMALAVVVLILASSLLLDLIVVAVFVCSVLLARMTFRLRVHLPVASP